ncbi:MarR family winged helix-turn-helix transcriptional regulator [Enterococcus sp. BWR-S5]|uniref:MarR family winged helix-turn-helix transcriptional regulator n=1 Tax=Enterococcus sp. BWR-S5 TaxID=2787714 RepID=UPI001924988B|nr:MarR family transcriptional regulator [Enterococcus sp. BWR-S5]MBL1226214.1 MarR family transcriptional regulator [Enterococcus sp. BWR-S5]
MSDYTEELLRNLSIVGTAGSRLINTAMLKKKAPTQQLVLDLLLEEDGMTQGVLAEILDIRPSSLTEILKKLEQRGEIERREDPNDKRIKQVFLTEAGRLKANPVKESQLRSEEFFAGLSEEEQRELNQLLNKVQNGWGADFCDLSDFPKLPFEMLDSVKEFREQFMQEFAGKDMRTMSPHERKEFKREMREMKHAMRRNFDHRSFKKREFDPFYREGKTERGRRSETFDKKEDSEWDNW